MPVLQDWTIAYDTATGAPVWSKSSLEGFENTLLDVAVSPDGSKVFVTGGGTGDWYTIAYTAATGAMIWTKQAGGAAGGDSAGALVCSPDGTKLYVTGSTDANTSDNRYDLLTVAYNTTTGARIWSRKVGGGAGHAIAASPNGTKVFVAGQTDGGGSSSSDYVTIALRAA
jgi:DNA-binding beta-propeller fold protein YncE